MGNEKSLAKYGEKCSGKQLFSCGICRDGFQTHSAMVKHTLKWYKADKSFNTTGVFIGRSRPQNSSAHT